MLGTSLAQTAIHGAGQTVLSALIRGSIHTFIGFIFVWAICKALPRLPAKIRLLLWVALCVKALLALAGPFAIHVPVSNLPQNFSAKVVTAARLGAGQLDPQPNHPLVSRSLVSNTARAYSSPKVSSPGVGTLQRSDWPTILALIWLVGFVAMCSRSWFRFSHLLQTIVPTNQEDMPQVYEAFERIRARANLRRSVSLAIASESASPFVVAHGKWIIALPLSLCGDDTLPELELALGHETAHVLGLHPILLSIVSLLEHVFWFFPIAKVISREAYQACEEIADAFAIRVTSDSQARRYASLLLILSETPRPALAVGLSSTFVSLERRLQAISQRNVAITRIVGRIHAIAASVALAALVPLQLAPVIGQKLLHAAGVPDAVPHYVIGSLDSSLFSASDALNINDQGDVAGAADNRPMIWTNGAGSPVKGLPKYHFGAILKINNQSNSLGSSYNYGNYQHGFIRSDKRFTLGHLPGYQYTIGLGMNEQGEVVGNVHTGQTTLTGLFRTRATLWSNNQVRDLGTLGGHYSSAYDINDSDVIVGKSDLSPSRVAVGAVPTHAFRWAGGHMADLGTLGGKYSVARAINREGTIVGWADTPHATHGFLSDGSAMTDLGCPPLFDDSYALAVNNTGTIVGYAVQRARGVRHAIVWQNGLARDLNSVVSHADGWVFVEAHSVNSQGQVAGLAMHNGKQTAFVVSPG